MGTRQPTFVQIVPQRDVVIGYLHPGQVAGKFCASLAQTAFRSPRIAGQIELQSSPRIAEARCQIVDAFASEFPHAEWLLMIDSDMVWTPEDVELLLASASRNERPIVGGLCFTWDGPGKVKPTLYRTLDASGASETIYEYPRDELVQVDSTGAAFLLVHRQVFAKMAEQFPGPYPWFREGVITKGGVALGEDTYFCSRSRSMGIPIFVHTGARIGHVKTTVLTEEMFVQPQSLT